MCIISTDHTYKVGIILVFASPHPNPNIHLTRLNRYHATVEFVNRHSPPFPFVGHLVLGNTKFALGTD